MRKVIIGLDIGTQFCYAGFWDEEKNIFQQLNLPENDKSPNADFVRKYGIPTDIALKSNGEPTFGIDADNKRKYFDEGEWYFLVGSSSIKTALRWQLKNTHPQVSVSFANSRGDKKTVLLIDKNNIENCIFYKFIAYIYTQIKSSLNSIFKEGEWQIKEVVFAYPGPRLESTNEYQKAVQIIIKKVFNLHKLPKYLTEGQVAAACLSTRLGFNSDLCFIDIGAGTTDIAIMQRQPNGKYDELYDRYFSPSTDFGGKNVDEELFSYGTEIRKLSSEAILKHKMKLFHSGDGELAGRSDSRRSSNQVEEAIENKWDNFVNILNEAKSIVRSNTTIILMGGTSQIPFINNKVKSVFGRDQVYSLCDESYAKRLGIKDANFISYAAATNHITYSQNGKSIEVGLVPDRIRGKAIALLSTKGKYHIIADGTKPQASINKKMTQDAWLCVEGEEETPAEMFSPPFYLISPPEENGKFSKDVYPKSEIEESIAYEFDEGEITIQSMCQNDDTHSEIRYYIGTAFEGRVEKFSWGKIFIYFWDNTGVEGAAKKCYPPAGKSEIKYEEFEEKIQDNLYAEEKIDITDKDMTIDSEDVTIDPDTIFGPNDDDLDDSDYSQLPSVEPAITYYDKEDARKSLRENYNHYQGRIGKIHLIRRKKLKEAYNRFYNKIGYCNSKSELDNLLQDADIEFMNI